MPDRSGRTTDRAEEDSAQSSVEQTDTASQAPRTQDEHLEVLFPMRVQDCSFLFPHSVSGDCPVCQKKLSVRVRQFWRAFRAHPKYVWWRILRKFGLE